jgi:undecaprenyl phosphate-alpha-L-ara4N flippase subunit ArnE
MAAPTIDFSVGGAFGNFCNGKLMLAVGVYVVATVLWMAVLKSTPLRIAYPFAALAFFIVPIAAHFVLGEYIGWNTFVGAGLIAAGVLVSVIR